MDNVLHAIEILLLIIIGLWQKSLDSYVKKKSENKAQKEDVADIKTLEESVANKFRLENTVESTIYNERKQVVKEMYVSIEKLIHKLWNVTEKSLEASVEFFDRTVEEIECDRKDLIIAQATFKLYVREEMPNKKLEVIVHSVVGLEYAVRNYLLEYRRLAKQVDALKRLMSITTSDEQRSSYAKQINELYAVCTELYQKDANAIRLDRNGISSLIASFEQYCSDVIHNKN